MMHAIHTAGWADALGRLQPTPAVAALPRDPLPWAVFAPPEAGPLPPPDGPPTARAGLLRTALGWWRRAQQRRVLLTLDDRLLRDIGLTRGEVERQARAPFWREAAGDE